ncbi:MAG: hypothetical protein ACRDN6_02990 [Gaiellaceae bacterium]
MRGAVISDLDRQAQTETGFGTGLRAHLLHLREPGRDGQAAADENRESSDHHEPPRGGEPQPAPAAADLEERIRTLETAETELLEFARRITDQQAALAEEAERLEVREAALASVRARRDVREVLRDRAEQHADLLWETLELALDATRPDGSADVHTRLAGMRTLLAVAYGDTQAPTSPTELGDELAKLRQRRAARGTP